MVLDISSLTPPLRGAPGALDWAPTCLAPSSLLKGCRVTARARASQAGHQADEDFAERTLGQSPRAQGGSQDGHHREVMESEMGPYSLGKPF